MNKSYKTIFLFLTLGVFIISGCAKQGVVKKDETLPQAAPANLAGPSSNKETTKESDIKAQPIKEASIKAPTMKDAQSIAQVEAALDKIFFDFDAYTLTPAARDTLARNAEAMKKKTGVKVLVEGNCDERGSDEYNLALGEKRAKIAVHYLVTMGVPAGRVSFISYGKEKPVDPGHNEAAWANNRRDEFVIISK